MNRWEALALLMPFGLQVFVPLQTDIQASHITVRALRGRGLVRVPDQVVTGRSNETPRSQRTFQRCPS